MTSPALILGIESSCDETAAAVVEGGVRVLSNVIASQHDLHAAYRGVVPEIASRAHAERILPVVERAVAEAGIGLDALTAVAVGNRPGLIGSLLVGVSAAKALAWSLGTPVIGIDHIEAHLYAGCLDAEPPQWPALGLVVSGGHTSLFHCTSPLEARTIGRTIDDAVGEAYDKVATILEVAYPGGPNLDRLAQTGDERAYDLPVSRLTKESLDFSFSGLKTAVLYTVRGVPETAPRRRGDGSGSGGGREGINLADDGARANVAASFQRAAVGAVLLKLNRALDRFPEVRTLLVGGGVSANSRLRADLATLAAERSLDLRLPRMDLCLDNAAMIAGLAHHHLAARGGVGDPLSVTAFPTSR